MASKFIKAAALVLAAVAAAVLFSACAKEPFRLRIIANSDSEADQEVKLAVRDAILSVTAEGVKQCESAAQAEEYIKENLGIILKTADETLLKGGFDYRAAAQLGRRRFPEKSYGGTKYPEGDYEALVISLGKGEGENWWCVIFPPLCLYDTQGGGGNAEDAQYTSFFAELWGALFGG